MSERDPMNEMNELSRMNRQLKPELSEELRGKSGKYSERLAIVAERTFRRSDLLKGTTISRPSLLVHGKRDRLQSKVMPIGFSMYTREIRTENGHLVMYPLHVTGLSFDGTPIIDPSVEGSYSIVHSLNDSDGKFINTSNPLDQKADLSFTVDEDNLVTVNGMNPVTAEEYALFDSIVCEFESRAGV